MKKLRTSDYKETQTIMNYIERANFGFYMTTTERNRNSRPLYISFTTVEKAESFKQWIFRAKFLLKRLGWTHDQIYQVNVSNKRSAESMRQCAEIQNIFTDDIQHP